mmetsp:Transcript_161091/g.283896  ORF Transcript_161091/g.283896 Transcript_161091/m.283896 type:complete len:587 (-) Transcript_161091:80-1840(-)
MRNFALGLACLACLGYGRRRLPTSSKQAQRSAISPLEALAVLLVGRNPRAAFDFSGSGGLHRLRAPVASQRSKNWRVPVLSMNDVEVKPAATGTLPPVPEDEFEDDDFDEEFDEDFEEDDFPFEDWAESAGIDAPCLAVTGEDVCRGVVVLQDIPAGGELCSVPRSSCLDLSTTTGKGSPCVDLLPTPLWRKLRWFERLSLWLVYEARRGENSIVSGYIGYLPDPEEFADGVLEWSDEELARLQYGPVIQSIEEQKAEQETLLALLKKEGGPLAQFVTLQEVRWAMSLVLSRAFMSGIKSDFELKKERKEQKKKANKLKFDGPGLLIMPKFMKDMLGDKEEEPDLDPGFGLEMAMMPMMDAFNHWSGAQNTCSYDGDRDSFVLTAGVNLAKNQEAFICYGQKSNDDLLQLFGFVEEGNPHDRWLSMGLEEFVMSPDNGFMDEVEAEQRAQVLYEFDLEDALLGELSSVGAPPRLLHAMRILLGNPSEAADAEALEKPASLETEERVWDALKEYCKWARNELGNSRKQDIAEARRAKILGDQRLAMAATFRAEKKRLLVELESRLTQQAMRSRRKGKVVGYVKAKTA